MFRPAKLTRPDLLRNLAREPFYTFPKRPEIERSLAFGAALSSRR
jgi:hypothetical protein